MVHRGFIKILFCKHDLIKVFIFDPNKQPYKSVIALNGNHFFYSIDKLYIRLINIWFYF